MLQEDNQDQTTADLAQVMFDTAVLRSGYDLQVCDQHHVQNLVVLSKPFAASTRHQWTLVRYKAATVNTQLETLHMFLCWLT